MTKPFRAHLGFDTNNQPVRNVPLADPSEVDYAASVEFVNFWNSVTEFSPTRNYPTDFVVKYNNNLWISNTAVLAGSWNASQWVMMDSSSWTYTTVDVSLEAVTITVIVDTRSNPVTVTLPNTPGANQTVTILDQYDSALANNITIDGQSKNIGIGGGTTRVISNQGALVTYVYDAAISTWVEMTPPINNPQWKFVSSDHSPLSNDWLAVQSSSGAINITLPGSPNNGDFINLIDISNNASVNNITVLRNGNTINNLAQDLVITRDGGYYQFVFYGGNWTGVDSTWVSDADIYDVVDVAGTTYTCTESNKAKIIEFDNDSKCFLTLPQQSTEILSRGWSTMVLNMGDGDIDILIEGSDTIDGGTIATVEDSSKYTAIILQRAGTPNTYKSAGNVVITP